MYEQLVQPNADTTGTIGNCLQFARKVFSAPAGPRNAWIAWNATNYKHLDRDFPNVAVPVWFSYMSSGENLGHVVTWFPDYNQFLSSPWARGTDHAWLPSISEIERIYKCSYVGWSEDINKVRVAQKATQEDSDYMANEDDIKRLYLACLGRAPTQEEINNRIKGKQTVGTALDELMDFNVTPEREAYITKVDAALAGQSVPGTVLAPGNYTVK